MNPYRAIQTVLPPYPGTLIMPSPPPYQKNSSGGSVITTSTGEVGQDFGNFMPSAWKSGGMHLDIVRHVAKITTTIMPKLTTIEESNSCDILMDTKVDTWCAGKHAYVLAIIEGISVSCRDLSDNLPVEENLPVVNIIYAYDCKKRGEVILLQLNHCIYLGGKKNDAIACPNQLRLFDIHVDERPAVLFLNEKRTWNASLQTV